MGRGSFLQWRRDHALRLPGGSKYLGDRLMTLAGILAAVVGAELVASSPWPHFRVLVWGILLLIALGLALVGFLTPSVPTPPTPPKSSPGPTFGEVNEVMNKATNPGSSSAEKNDSNEAERTAQGGDSGALPPGQA